MPKTYLLSAPEDDMNRWKSEAKARGLSFAAHVRECLEHRSSGCEPSCDPASGCEIPGTGLDGTPVVVHHVPKRTYDPDPK